MSMREPHPLVSAQEAEFSLDGHGCPGFWGALCASWRFGGALRAENSDTAVGTLASVLSDPGLCHVGLCGRCPKAPVGSGVTGSPEGPLQGSGPSQAVK